MDNKTPKPGTYAAREIKYSFWAVFSSLAWGLSLALSLLVLATTPEPNFLFGIFALLINLATGIAALVAHIRLFKNLDEMIRKIWIESMAMTFGLLWIAFGSLIILDRAEINSIDHVDLGLLIVLAGVGFASGGFRTLKY